MKLKLKVNFGEYASRETTWEKDLMDFPKLIRMYGYNYEWVMYQKDDTSLYDYILHFTKLGSHDSDYHNEEIRTWYDLFVAGGGYVCECGAIHSSFPWDHLRYCKLWRPW